MTTNGCPNWMPFSRACKLGEACTCPKEPPRPSYGNATQRAKWSDDKMIAGFERFDRENPAIWDYFKIFAKEAIAAGVRKLSASLIVERIRWEVLIQTRSVDNFKVNNNWRAFYARKFMKEFPDCGATFETRASAADQMADAV